MDRSGSPAGKLGWSRTRSFGPAAIDEDLSAHDLDQELAIPNLLDVAQHAGCGEGRIDAVFVDLQQHSREHWGAFMYGPQGDPSLGCSEPAPYAQQPFRPTWVAGLVELTEFVMHKRSLGYCK